MNLEIVSFITWKGLIDYIIFSKIQIKEANIILLYKPELIIEK